MISKSEAISRLKKMGVVVVDDQSIVTVLLPENTSFSAGIKDIREKLKNMDYDASFCIRQSKTGSAGETDEIQEEPSDTEEAVAEDMDSVATDIEDTVTQEELNSSLMSMDDDGQFTLEGFGLDF